MCFGEKHLLTLYRYRFISESGIKCSDNIGTSDIDKKSISDIPTYNMWAEQ